MTGEYELEPGPAGRTVVAWLVAVAVAVAAAATTVWWVVS